MSLRHSAVLAAGFSAILLSACGEDDPTPPPVQAFTLAVAPTTLSVQAGGVPTSIALASVASEADAALANAAAAAGTGTLNVTITRSGGFEGPVTIAVEGLPTGVTASALTIAAGLLTGTITITAAANATVATSTLTIRGTGTGVTQQTANVQLTITASPSFALTLTPTALSVQQGQSGTATANIARSGGFAGSVALTSTGAPAGVTVAFNPASATGATSDISVGVAATVQQGVYPITVQGASTGLTNQTAVLTLTVTAPPTPAVALSLAPVTVSIAQGQSGSSTLTLARTNFTGAVALTSTGAPAGMTVTFNPTSVTGTTSGITVDVGAAVLVGPYPIVIQGAGTGIANANVTLMVNVTAPPASSIALSIAPSALTIQAGASGTATATLVRTNFTGDVTLTSTGAPAGITVTFNPAPLTGTTLTSTVTVTVGAAVLGGIHPITLTGAGTGVANATTVLTVTVTAPSIALSVAPTTLSVAAGASGTSTVTLVRTNFTADVALTSTGAPAGMTVTFSPANLTGTTLTSTATVDVGAAVALGPHTITVQGAGTGVANATAVLTVTVTAAAGSIVLTTNPATLSIQQGGTGSSTLTIARTNFTGTVNLTSTGAPTGMTVSFNPAAATGTTSTVTVAVGAAVQQGTHQVTLTGAGTGITNATTVLSVTVTAPGSGNVGLTFCAQTGIPLWVGYQDFGGAWTQAVAVNNVYSFNITTKGAVAWVLPVAGGKTSLQIMYGTQAELSLRGTSQCVGSGALKAINVTAVGVTATDFAFIAMNGGAATISGATGPFTAPLQPGVRDGLVDLIGVRSVLSGTSLTPNSIVIQRDRNDASGTTVTVDFATGVAPVTQTATIGNLLGQQAIVSSLFFSKNGTAGSISSAQPSASTTHTWQGVPAASVIDGDYHLMNVFAYTGTVGLPYRAITQYNKLAADRTYTLPDAITTPPTITVTGTSPYVTLTTNWAIQSAQYNQFWSFSFVPTSGSGSVSFVSVTGTAGYFGSGPVQLAIPNFGSSFTAAHGLQPGIPLTWTFLAAGGTLYTQPNGATQLEGYISSLAAVGGTITP